jgi:ATP adenylyltransferase
MGYVSKKKNKGCIFCQMVKSKENKKNHVFIRSKHCFAVLNTFPYNNGHLMVIPYKHTASPLELSSEVVIDMQHTLNRCMILCQKILKPHGFNIGTNIGAAAGAGIDQHLHTHLVPRWNGDCNFMPTTAGTKVIPQSLNHFYELITKELKNAKI